MSVPTKEQAVTFLAPLRGGLTVMTSHDVQARMRLSRHILMCASVQAMETTILDTDAFYCTNMDRLIDEAHPVKGSVTLLPERGFEAESLLPLLSSKSDMVIIDDLNSLSSLAPDGRRLHQLMVVLKLFSLNARVNGSWVVATAFRPKSGDREGPSQRSLAALGDIAVDTDFQGGSLRLRKSLWPDGELEV